MKLVVLDTETGGLNPREHQVIEVAWQVVDDLSDDISVEFINSLVLPHFPHLVEGSAAAVNGYYKRGLNDPAKWAGEADLLVLEDALDGATLLGANIAFDAAFLTNIFPNRPWKYRMLDIESIAYGIFSWGWDEVRGLKDIADELRAQGSGYDIPEPDHTAVGDVRTTVACFRALKEIADFSARVTINAGPFAPLLAA